VGVKVTLTPEVVVPVAGDAFNQTGRVLGLTVKNTAGEAETVVLAPV
jgi:hypothetical protein